MSDDNQNTADFQGRRNLLQNLLKETVAASQAIHNRGTYRLADLDCLPNG